MDALIIGAGITGATIARELANNGLNIIIWDKRSHIGGNAYDYVDDHGILVHKYGPHTFHTNKLDLYEYINRFSEWTDFKLKCGAYINGRITPTPFNFKTIDTYFPGIKAKLIKQSLMKCFSNRKTITVLEALSARDYYIREYAEFLYNNDYKLYTSKQWGIPLENIDVSIFKRVPLQLSFDEGYFLDRYQVMPKYGYTSFFKNLLDHENIKVILEKDALEHLSIGTDDRVYIDGNEVSGPVIYTGPLDELFSCSEGELQYRSVVYQLEYEPIVSKQPYPVVAYPQDEEYTRITEYKKLTRQKVMGTTFSKEFPLKYKRQCLLEPYYPVNTTESDYVYNKYKIKADKVKKLYICGRLGDFKYYNMDMALERALDISKNIIRLNFHRG